ncbi:MAG: hypothetical protein ACE5EQ_00740 [Phycisphaerae bacterium]
MPVTGDDSEDGDDEDRGSGEEEEEKEAVGGAHPTLFSILFGAWADCGGVEISAVVDIGCLQVPVENGTIVRLKCKDGCRVHEKDDRLDIEAAAAILIVTAVDEAGIRLTARWCFARRRMRVRMGMETTILTIEKAS